MPSVSSDGHPLQRHLNAHPGDGSQELRALIIDLQSSHESYVNLLRTLTGKLQHAEQRLRGYEDSYVLPPRVGQELVEKIEEMMGR